MRDVVGYCDLKGTAESNDKVFGSYIKNFNTLTLSHSFRSNGQHNRLNHSIEHQFIKQFLFFFFLNCFVLFVSFIYYLPLCRYIIFVCLFICFKKRVFSFVALTAGKMNHVLIMLRLL